jgi:hypothetical protein
LTKNLHRLGADDRPLYPTTLLIKTQATAAVKAVFVNIWYVKGVTRLTVEYFHLVAVQKALK